MEENVHLKLKVYIQNSVEFEQRFRTENFEAHVPFKEKIKRFEAFSSFQDEREEVVSLDKEKWRS